ncbi:MAG: LysR family transcriptional regulator [Hyphomicrobiales bacterium]|nr:LysR family transcriptional regulator [Hyphomicrobiales bacterium]
MDTNRDIFDGMIVFCEVVEANGFAAAARNLGHAASHVSKEVARLEARLGTRVLNRTTRTISLTEAGRAYYDQARQVIEDARCAQERILSANEKPFGLLRVSAPVSLSLTTLNRWLPEFLDRYPEIRMQVDSSDRRVDLVAEGFDVVVRAGRLDDTDLIATRLDTARLLTVAAPDYLGGHGTPATPADLTGHTLIDFSQREIAARWSYRGEGGTTVAVTVAPRVVCNSAETEAALAIAGVGITRLPSFACSAELVSGALVPILEAFEEPPIGVYAVYPSRAHLAAKVRVFVDFLRLKFKETP